MGQFHILVLLLATVALSSSNVLPIFEKQLNKESYDFDGRYNDNIRSNRYQTKNALNEIYKFYVTKENNPTRDKLQFMFTDPDNNRDTDIINIFNKNDNYNGEGFRKEQWHNYPRQLDRLHQMYEQSEEKRNYEADLTKEQYSEEIAPDKNDINDVTNEFPLLSNTETNNIYDIVMAANPLLTLKIRLACLTDNVDHTNNYCFNLITSELKSSYQSKDDKNEHELKDKNPILNVMKVKREDISNTQNSELTEDALNENKTVNKRIFSLWSRLQNLSPKAHELQHRRHLHAYYGLSDSDSSGILTAETRATLMRPPGSPLRWG